MNASAGVHLSSGGQEVVADHLCAAGGAPTSVLCVKRGRGREGEKRRQGGTGTDDEEKKITSFLVASRGQHPIPAPSCRR